MLTHIKARAQQLAKPESPIPFQLTDKGVEKGKAKRTLGYHPMTDDWRISPWDCKDPGPLTVAEALNVLTTHGDCGDECRISRTARKVRARVIDAPTVRAKAFRRPSKRRH